MTTRMWRRVLAGVVGGLLGLNLVSAVLGWATICATGRETLHLERTAGRVGLVVGYIVACSWFGRWWLPHMLDPAKRPPRSPSGT